MAARFAAKLKLVRILYERGWDRQRIIDLFTVIDWMMRLPEDLTGQLWQEIEAIEEGAKMRYVTSVERLGIDKGIILGETKGKAETLLRQLRHRFHTLAPDLEIRVQKAEGDQLDEWLDRILDAKTLTDVFPDLAH